MQTTTVQKMQCAVAGESCKPCGGEVQEVHWLPGKEEAGRPGSLPLCQIHHQLELLVWGRRRFIETYPGLQWRETPGQRVPEWREVLEAGFPEEDPHRRDRLLNFSTPDDLEILRNLSLAEAGPAGDYHPREQYAHLKDAGIDLEYASLTDRQLMAVCMVFYGGVKKNRAARAMKISSQALSDHLRAALRKIQECLFG